MKGSKILIATDLSESAKVAARWAQKFSELTGKPVDVGYAVPINLPNWVSGSYAIEDNEEVREQARQKVVDWYEQTTGEIPDGVRIEAGKAADELREMVEDDGDYAALVVAMSGKGAVERFLIGSTTSSLALNPPCPLVIANPEESGLGGDTDVVVGTDFSESAANAIDLGAEFANLLGVSLHILHATASDLEDIVDSDNVPEELRSETRYRYATERLEKIGEEHSELLGDQEFDTTVVKDYPPQAIHELAAEPKIGIAVVGESDRSKLSQTVVGSVGLKLVQSMPATIVVTP